MTTPIHVDSLPLEQSSDAPIELHRLGVVSIWIFWAFIAALTFINALLNGSPNFKVPVPAAAPLLAAFIDCLIWAMLTPVLFRLTHRYGLESKQWLRSVIAFLALGVLLSIVVAKAMTYVRYQLAVYFLPASAGSLTTPSMQSQFWRNFWFMSELSAYMVIVAAGFAYNYLLRYRVQTQQAAQLRVELAHAKLDVLRAQLNPHFLFNTLNTIAALIEIDPPAARQTMTRLSELLRETLDNSAPEVSLQRELNFTRRYIDIMRTRFTGQLDNAENVSPEALEALVPTLLLQPLVENAIKHGIDKLDGPGRIQINARRAGNELVLSVIDNGSCNRDKDAVESSGTGLGLRNTRARLTQSYADQQSLTLTTLHDGGTEVRVTLPFHTEANDPVLVQ